MDDAKTQKMWVESQKREHAEEAQRNAEEEKAYAD